MHSQRASRSVSANNRLRNTAGVTYFHDIGLQGLPLPFGEAEDTLRCDVSDDGPDGIPASGDAGSQSGDTVPWNMEPGHGLWLIRQIADQASVRSGLGGTVAVVSFALGPPGRLPPFRLDRRAAGPARSMRSWTCPRCRLAHAWRRPSRSATPNR
jgi:hypothetical protein